MRPGWAFAIGAAAGLAAGLAPWLGGCGGGPASAPARDTVTITVRDTVRGPSAVRIVQAVRAPVRLPLWPGLDTVRDTALLRDTVTVALPVERAEYAGETADGAAWRAWLSGYRPRLDSLAVSWPERTVTERRGRWSVGITAGAGWTRGGFGPYIGVGLTYSLWSF